MSTAKNNFTIDSDSLVTRLKEACDLASDKDLAEIFGLSQQDFAARKKRGTLLSFVIEYAINKHIDLNWLFTGLSATPFADSGQEVQSEPTEDPELAELILGARKVLTSGNQIACDALTRNIQYFSHAIETEKQLKAINSRVSHLEEMLSSILDKNGQHKDSKE